MFFVSASVPSRSASMSVSRCSDKNICVSSSSTAIIPDTPSSFAWKEAATFPSLFVSNRMSIHPFSFFPRTTFKDTAVTPSPVCTGIIKLSSLDFFAHNWNCIVACFIARTSMVFTSGSSIIIVSITCSATSASVSCASANSSGVFIDSPNASRTCCFKSSIFSTESVEKLYSFHNLSIIWFGWRSILLTAIIFATLLLIS